MSADTLDAAGLRKICYTSEEDENLGQFSDGEPITLSQALPTKATYDTPAHQWEESSFGYLPSIPCGESFRFPVHNKAGEKVGYTYHRFKSYDFETSPEIVTYQGYKAKRQATFLPCNAQLLADPDVPLVFVENPFQALRVHQNGGAVVSLNGSMKYGFSAQGHFAPFGIEEVRQRVWTPEDATALFEMLNLNEIPCTSSRKTLILCELGWLRCEYLEMAVPLLQQVIALNRRLQDLGACSRVLTAPISGPGNWKPEVRLDQMLGNGQWAMGNGIWMTSPVTMAGPDSIRPDNLQSRAQNLVLPRARFSRFRALYCLMLIATTRVLAVIRAVLRLF